MPAVQEAVELAVAACDAAAEKKGRDPVILEVADILGVVDLFVIVGAGSDRQLKAVAEEIQQALRDERDRRPLRTEGTADSGWMLLDYGDVVCHVFLEERRSFYDLERLWSDVPRRDPGTGSREDAGVGAEA